MQARFSFTSPGFSVEFEGTEAFVSEQIQGISARVRRIIRGAADAAEGAPPDPGGEDAPGGTTLETVFGSANIRGGRGALQDSILLFAHYLQNDQGKHEFTIEDLDFCFDLLDLRRPRSLANTLGILKRDRGLLHSGSRRGSYALSDKGKEQVRRLL